MMPAMKLPAQAQPVRRVAAIAGIGAGIAPAGPCENHCNALPEPARSICKASCSLRAA